MTTTTDPEIRALLAAARDGDREARGQLFERLYAELKKVAAAYLRGQRRDQTLDPTALVHEAFLRLFDADIRSRSRGELLSLAATAMRRILIDGARRKSAQKRAAGERLTWRDSAFDVATDDREAYVVLLDEALGGLAAQDAQLARIVEMRFFGGFSVDETADALGLSPATVKRRWRLAKAWLQREIEGMSDG